MKSWIRKGMLAVFVPIGLLGLTEWTLRFFDVGYSPDFLVETEVDGEAVWADNPFFTYHMFAPPLARTPAPIIAAKNKPGDVFRIVVLGESAAQGDPIPDFGPPRVLDFVLHHRAPHVHVEVINAAITAINSHAIREIAGELNKLQPDLVILYIGNNEVIGPFGPGTVFSGYLDSDVMIRFASRVNRLRLAQLLRFSLADGGAGSARKAFEGVSMFMDHPVRQDDPRLVSVYRRFEDNMRAIIQAARDTGAEVLLSTVAGNLSDCPPSISVHRDDVSEEEKGDWSRRFEQGRLLALSNDWEAAVAEFGEAIAIDDHVAEAHYMMGVGLEKLGRDAEADNYLSRARDLDAFRFRADTRLNDIIRKLASSESPSVTLVDIDRVFRNHPEWDDADMFVDHVHFSFTGTVRLTDLWADAIMNGWTTTVIQAEGKLLDPEQIQETMLYTDVAAISVWQEMRRRFQNPPFNRHLDHEARIAELDQRIQAATGRLRDSLEDDRAAAYRDRMIRFPDDIYFPDHFAQDAITRNRFSSALAISTNALQRYPHRRGPRATTAYLLARDGRAEEAVEVLLSHQKKQGYFAVISASYLFNVLIAGGAYDEAVKVGRVLVDAVRPADYRDHIRNQLVEVTWIRDQISITREHLERGETQTAERVLIALLKIRPDIADAVYLLGLVQARLGNPDKGDQRVQQAVNMMNFARAYYHAGLWQIRTGTINSAKEYLVLAENHAGDDLELINSMAWLYLAAPRQEIRNPSHALEMLQHAADKQITPSARLLDTLSAALAARGDLESAVETSEKAAAAAIREQHLKLWEEIANRRDSMDTDPRIGWGKINRPINFY